MSKIEVGEYVRTKRGYIAKLEDTDIEPNRKMYWFDDIIYYDWGEGIDFLEEEEIEKYIKTHSKNILDIVEVGDYINGDIVNQITKNYISVGYITIGKRNIKNIKSILTHEQYEQNCYKVVE